MTINAINAATTLLFTTTVSRFYDFYRNRREFTELAHELHLNVREMLKSDRKDEKAIIEAHISYVNNLTVAFWTCALVTANSMCINTFIEWLTYPLDAPEGVSGSLVPNIYLFLSYQNVKFPIFSLKYRLSFDRGCQSPSPTTHSTSFTLSNCMSCGWAC